MKKLDKLLKDKSGIRLDIGGGWNPVGKNWVNIDYADYPEVDIIHNLEEFPWPLPDESASVAVCRHVIEHIDPAHGKFIKFMDEVWRILKPDSQLAIITPYAGSFRYFQDPTHVNPCNEGTFSYFDPLDDLTNGHLYQVYRPKPWKIESRVWNESGDLQVIMKKRRIDPSYGVSGTDRQK